MSEAATTAMENPGGHAPRGKSAIVTGSTSGIGLAIACALAGSGMNVTLNGFGDAAEIERTRAGLANACGVGVAYSAADMMMPADTERMVAEATDGFGSIDVLVNNSGIFHVEAVETTPPAKWDATLQSHGRIPRYPRCAAGHEGARLEPDHQRRICRRPGRPGECRGLCRLQARHGRAVALEVAEHGITVNAIYPGYVLTTLVEREVHKTAKARGVSEEQVKSEFLVETQPTWQFVTPAEIGASVAFPCSDAARSITGAALPIDGGWTAR